MDNSITYNTENEFPFGDPQDVDIPADEMDQIPDEAQPHTIEIDEEYAQNIYRWQAEALEYLHQKEAALVTATMIYDEAEATFVFSTDFRVSKTDKEGNTIYVAPSNDTDRKSLIQIWSPLVELRKKMINADIEYKRAKSSYDQARSSVQMIDTCLRIYEKSRK